MEVNSFNPVLSEKKTFQIWLEGSELESMRGTTLELGGVYARLDQENDVETTPGFFAQACASGPLKDDDFQKMMDHLLDTLNRAGEVDGILLVLHGALQSTLIDDCEGFILEKVRKTVGEKIPICVSLDFHAMFTKKMLQNMTSVSGYQTYPHIDHFETGFRVADQLMYIIRSGIKPYKLYHEIPMIMSCENSNTIDSPMAEIMKETQKLLDDPCVIGGSVFLTQPWLDAPELNCSIVIFASDTCRREEIDWKAKKIIDEIWDKRKEFFLPMPKIDEALKLCETMPKPICLVDFGDVPNAGGCGDGTVVLKALLENKRRYLSVVVIADCESVKKAVSLGIGKRGEFKIGRSDIPGAYNERISVTGDVVALSNNPVVHQGPAMKGYVSQPGMRALIKCENIYIIICEKVCISHDQAMLRSMGIDPAQIEIIVMRATHSFMSCYADIMKSWLYVDTPGYSSRNLKELPFKKCRRPIYPLDEI